MDRNMISLQLYSLRQYTPSDFRGTVKKVAQMGYKGVEFAGYNGLSAGELKALLDECGLKAIGTHAAYKDLQENIQGVIDFNLEIGNKYIVCPGGVPLHNKDAFQTACENFNKFGEICNQNNLMFGYHNHWHEFKTFDDGTVGYDILLKETDPSLVFFEMDTCWVSFAGFNPSEYCKNYPGRFRLAHIKDYCGEKTENGRKHAIQCNIGTGKMQFRKLIPELETNGTDYLIIEQEGGTTDPIIYVEESLHNLKKILAEL